ncbi:MAG: hypothetical protein ABFD70_01955 [Syntrophaceae bacterium]|nr:hypothetical protein [Deltaproteobacteria bacterium]
MAGPADISTILSQAGRIEKINQNPFVQSEVTRQILTEEEARQRLRRNREVMESKKAQEISVRERTRDDRRQERPKDEKPLQETSETKEDDHPQGVKHLIDVVV